MLRTDETSPINSMAFTAKNISLACTFDNAITFAFF